MLTSVFLEVFGPKMNPKRSQMPFRPVQPSLQNSSSGAAFHIGKSQYILFQQIHSIEIIFDLILLGNGRPVIPRHELEGTFRTRYFESLCESVMQIVYIAVQK